MSCVLLCDAPGTSLGKLLTDFWAAFDEDKEISDFLNSQIKQSEAAQKEDKICRAGHCWLFPLGTSDVCLLPHIFLFRLSAAQRPQHEGVSRIVRWPPLHLIRGVYAGGMVSNQKPLSRVGDFDLGPDEGDYPPEYQELQISG